MKTEISVNTNVNIKNITKFLVGSSIGVFMFLFPVPSEGGFTTAIGVLSDFLKGSTGTYMPYFIVLIMLITATMSLVDYVFKPAFIRDNKMLKSLFSSSLLYVASKVIALVIAFMVVFKLGPASVISADTGGTMMGLSGTLIAIAFALSYILPFLTDCGIMEFLGVILKPVVRPLFKVPGRASVDLVSSWVGAANSAVILTRGQYMGGFYSAREAGIIMTNFSLVSIPFCLIIAETLGLQDKFPVFYLTTCVVGLLLAVIMPRVPPLSTLPDTFNKKSGKQINEEVPENCTRLSWAIEQSCKRAANFKLKDIAEGGTDILLGILFNLIPTVIAWGTVGLLVVEYTPVFEYLSYPIGFLLNVMGVEHAFEVAPATLVGFADMFIPALLVVGIESAKTKFIIGVLSLVQIIYMTEVGAIIIQSEVPLTLTKLFVIFIERTIIALPIIVLIANMVF